MLALTGCGQSQHDHATSTTVATSATVSTSTTVATSNQPAGKQCPAERGRRITITNGDLTCAEAYAIAAKFDLQGQKYQDIDAFECGTGTADVRPLEFQCTSEDVEFAVYGD